MNIRKSISLILTIIIILAVGIGSYYFLNLKKGPYPASELLSVEYKWGVGELLVNVYNSSTGNYQYLDSRDSLIRTKLKLNANSLIYLHSKANEAGFWQLPNIIANPNSDLKSTKVLRYEITFNYEKRKKTIIFMSDYHQDGKIAEAIEKIRASIEQVLKEREEN